MAQANGGFSNRRPLVFGEVLFDHFLGEDTRVLGGAPFNVAWHLQGFGLQPLFISRVGNDAEGNAVLAAMRDWGMDTRGVQRDAQHPTGEVEIRLESGQPSFDILPDRAYDFIEYEPAELLVRSDPCGLLYHGSLAARSPRSRRTLEELHRHLSLPAFVDINLRAPWWSPASIRNLLREKDWVKLNRDELAALADGPLTADGMDAAAAGLRRRLDIGALIVTLGSDGALMAEESEIVHGSPVMIGQVMDTVGAGDAFSAVAILGRIHGWDATRTLERAMAFASTICTVRGATTTDQDLYNRYLDQWGV